MKLERYKLIFLIAGLIGVLIIASPALTGFIHFPSGERLSELYLLGSGNMMANYPFNIAVGQNNSVNVGVTNQLGSSAYYVLYVELKNQTDPFPNATTESPSSLPPLYEYRFFASNDQTWESKLNFTVSAATFSESQSIIKVLTINNFAFNANKPAEWDATDKTFTYQLLFELWTYNTKTSSVTYNNRYVNLQLNLTQSS